MFTPQYWSAQYFDPVWFAPGDESHVPEEQLKGGGFAPWYVFPVYYADEDEREEEIRPVEIDKVKMLAEMFPAKEQKPKKRRKPGKALRDAVEVEAVSLASEQQLDALEARSVATKAIQKADEAAKAVEAVDKDAEAAKAKQNIAAALLMFEMM